MEYSEFTAWMFGLERFGIKLGLDNVSEFLSRIGNPQKDFRSIHITGTNGKGSVCAFVARMLEEHGLKVGLYTSPHLVDFRERIKINGEEIPEPDVVRIGHELRTVMQSMVSESAEKQLTFFEFTTGMAFRFFSERKVDLVVAEVGLGGRLDATNVLQPEVSAITRIGLEHTNYLGATLPEIAREKAGIIKAGVPVITCERGPAALGVIENMCERKGSALRKIGRDFDVGGISQDLSGTSFEYRGRLTLGSVRINVLGAYQAENAAAAIAVVEELNEKGYSITEQEIRQGLHATRWPGRLEVVSKVPFLMFDGSHNPDGVKTTVGVLSALGLTPMTFVIGCMDDKDYRHIVRGLAPVAVRMIVTQAKYKRALPATILAKVASEEFGGPVEAIEDPGKAIERAMAGDTGKGVCVIGSLYLVGEAMQWWDEKLGVAHGQTHKV
ncbi:MAG: bifunctional folylpolyglutamate synthase/dihydrofolate synthase [Thermoplasmata archaeon]|jgi:dihydrofolate synthase/folylpolyglutamate synthase|nr:bifunctional folylpolyglutamate synthase/dihydrofolate synthase [Thermoplasmata archaeon]